MTTLTEFLMARIAEDEAQARKHLPDAERNGWSAYPARVLAECEAKRRIVEGYVHIESMDRGSDSFTIAEIEYAERILPALALPYADHPDCDPGWGP